MKKINIADYHTLAEEHNFEWIGEKLPRNTGTNTLWRCSNSHEWKARYSSIKVGGGCPHCAGIAPKTEQDYHELAGNRGYKWLGKHLPKNTNVKTLWQCSEGHKWEARYGSIRNGSGCPCCYGNVSITEQDYHKLAKSRGFRWLGEHLPKNTKVKTTWQCSEGHKWKISYRSIRGGSGCPHCYGNAPKTKRDFYELGESKGFKWLGTEDVSVHTDTKWQCSKGHRWEATYNNIKKGSGCPYCVDMVNGKFVSNPQRRLCDMTGGKLNYPFGDYRIDIALPKEKIAIEYDCWFWHGHKLDEDIERGKELLAAGWKVLRIRTNNDMPSKQRIDSALSRLRNGENRIVITMPSWGEGDTFADVREREKVDPWELGPIPISFDGGMTTYEAQQLKLWDEIIEER